MKRLIRFLLAAALLLLCNGCDTAELGWGTSHVADPAHYGNQGNYIELPDYFPEAVSEYTVNSYSYTLYAYMDICYEIFLDLTVTEAQFDSLLLHVRALPNIQMEREAYYAEGYYEIVFQDSYSLNPDEQFERDPATVWNANIEKVIYNPETFHIIFERFDAFDSGVYPLNEVAYFNRFEIDPYEYVTMLP